MRIIDYAENKEILSFIMERVNIDHGDAAVLVADILRAVRENGDQALFSYTKEFDGFDLSEKNIKVTKDEIKAAKEECSAELLGVLCRAATRIEDFHMRQKRSGFIDTYPSGEILGQLVLPIETVGVYCPGGTAPYPASVLMNIIPAKIAGVRDIIMATPPGRDGIINPIILTAAQIAGCENIYKLGGAQAIAAFAYGTKSVPKADKITGPGNIYVALAKHMVFGHVGIDSIAGPSEILIIADDTANPLYLAADLLSQAEHDALAASILITNSVKIARETAEEIERQLAQTERREIARRAIENYGAIVITKTLEEAFEISNDIAPEHLEICTADAFSYLPLVKNAGAVFLGHYTPEPLGDYLAGPNHILPTNRTARFFSPLCVDDFTKKTSVIHFPREAFEKVASDCVAFARSEGFYAHANAVKVRSEHISYRLQE